MATVVNARDVALQATNPRILPVNLPSNISVPPEQVPGLSEVFTTSKEVVIRASSQVFQVPKTGATSPTNLTLTAILKNITGTPVFTVVEGTANLNVVGNVATLFPANMTTNTATIEVSVIFAGTTYKDKITVVKVAEGIDSVVGFLTNESMVVDADSAGTVAPAKLAAAGGTFKVYDGVTDKTGNAAVTYSVVSSSGVNVTLAATGVYTINSMSADSGTATLRAVYKGVTIDKVYAISKSKAGVNGTNGIRGTVNIARAISTMAWSNTEANLALSSNGYGSPQLRDIVTLYNTANAYSETRFYDGTTWSTLDAYVNGNMLVTGTVSADKLSVTSLSAISSVIGLLRTATTGERTELDNNGIRVYDANNIMRVRLGVW